MAPDAWYNLYASLSIDPLVARTMLAAVLTEGGLHAPFPPGDNNQSFGPFQMHDRGAGAGLTRAQREDPVFSSRYMHEHEFRPAYVQGVARGYDGERLAAFTYLRAERPAGYRTPTDWGEGSGAAARFLAHWRTLADRTGEEPMPEYVFPVAGTCQWSDTHWDSNGDGQPDRAVDIFAAEGTPIVAIWDGVAHVVNYPNGGHTVSLELAPNPLGIAWAYHAHLPYGTGVAGRVARGQQIGQVGRTGNARTTPPHCHYAMGADIDNAGQGTVAPWPLLRAWQAGTPPVEEEDSLSAEERTELESLRELKPQYDDLKNYTSALTDTILPGALGTMETAARQSRAALRGVVLGQCQAIRDGAGI